MKSFLRAKVVEILSSQSRQMLAKHQPIIIAITGNVGKTTTKDYIYNFLEYKFGDEVRASEKSQNSEFGVNLTIMGEQNAWNNPFAWLKIILRNYYKIFFEKNYPKTLVLEVGADKPGDIRYITSIIKPDVAVLTAFQPSPSHGEFFLNIDQHINEKKVLVDSLKDEGIIVYNNDDEIMSKMAHEAKEKNPTIQLFSFGTKTDSNVVISEVGNLYSEEAELLGIKIKFQINFANKNSDLELRFYGITGSAHAYSIACAICVSILNGYNKEDLQNAVNYLEEHVELSKSRMRLLDGKNNSKIIDDSYNSSPLACVNALETLSKILCKGKKIGILGHMAELGDKTKQEHFNIGLIASKVFDIVILSGKFNDFYLEGLREGKFDLGKIFLAKNPKEVLKIIHDNDLLKENDIVLVKGSQSARLEKVVVGLLINPHDTEYVCRQDEEWKRR